MQFRQADEEFGRNTPWDSVFKLEWVHKKAANGPNTRERIIWQLSGINDLVRTRQIVPDELCVNQLSGKGLGGGRGMLDLLLFKLDLLDDFIDNQAGNCGLSSEAKAIVRAIVDSHSSYRARIGDNVDMTWMLTVPQSAKAFVELVGDRC